MNKTQAGLLTLLTLFACLSACSEVQSEVYDPTVTRVPNSYGAKVTYVKMMDGTNCYVATGSGHGIAITCFQNK